jgi:hypothetical protein
VGGSEQNRPDEGRMHLKLAILGARELELSDTSVSYLIATLVKTACDLGNIGGKGFSTMDR